MALIVDMIMYLKLGAMLNRPLVHSTAKILQWLGFCEWLLWIMMVSHPAHQHIGFLLCSKFLYMGGDSVVVVLDQDVEIYVKHV